MHNAVLAEVNGNARRGRSYIRPIGTYFPTQHTHTLTPRQKWPDCSGLFLPGWYSFTPVSSLASHSSWALLTRIPTSKTMELVSIISIPHWFPEFNGIRSSALLDSWLEIDLAGQLAF